jgi:hypothetical protein
MTGWGWLCCEGLTNEFFSMWSIFHRSIIRLRYLSCVVPDRIMLRYDTEYAGPARATPPSIIHFLRPNPEHIPFLQISIGIVRLHHFSLYRFLSKANHEASHYYSTNSYIGYITRSNAVITFKKQLTEVS